VAPTLASGKQRIARRRGRARDAARHRVRVGIVAGEISGDLLGAGLMRALKHRFPGISFEGIGGPAMQEAGCRSLYPMERLSLIGFEVLEKLPGLLRMRRELAAHFLADPPDAFIGVDAPDFNLGLEAMLKRAGVRTVHYVSPTVWAWRRWRIRTIRRGVDLMLTLFPFEASFYHRHDVPVAFVGHPLADAIPERYDPKAVRRRLDLPTSVKLIALLPGSRVSELNRHADLFVKTALWLAARRPNLHFVAPFVNARTRGIFERALKNNHAGHLPVTRLIGRSRDVMAAADIVVLASGTATLEAAMLQKPMVVTYRLAWFSYLLVRLLVRVRDYALPNLLAGRRVVSELIQADAVPEKLGAATEHLLTHPGEIRRLKGTLGRLHRALKRNASERAADAVARLLKHAGSRPRAR
jgi:lipid-A-disaccharide synthase